jgi:hypothetical protein
MAMLEHTHLYGRHLVLDYAKEDDGLDEIREKTKSLFDANQPITPEQASRKQARMALANATTSTTNNTTNSNNNNSGSVGNANSNNSNGASPMTKNNDKRKKT